MANCGFSDEAELRYLCFGFVYFAVINLCSDKTEADCIEEFKFISTYLPCLILIMLILQILKKKNILLEHQVL